MTKRENDNRTQKPLEWKVEDELVKGKVHAEITSAILYNGTKRYSIKFFTLMRDDKRGTFFRDTDMESIAILSEEVRFWVQADLDESSKSDKRRKFG